MYLTFFFIDLPSCGYDNISTCEDLLSLPACLPACAMEDPLLQVQLRPSDCLAEGGGNCLARACVGRSGDRSGIAWPGRSSTATSHPLSPLCPLLPASAPRRPAFAPPLSPYQHCRALSLFQSYPALPVSLCLCFNLTSSQSLFLTHLHCQSHCPLSLLLCHPLLPPWPHCALGSQSCPHLCAHIHPRGFSALVYCSSAP